MDYESPMIIINGDLDAAGYVEMLKRDFSNTIIANITGGRGYMPTTELHRTRRWPA
jgi:hypothetical protein